MGWTIGGLHRFCLIHWLQLAKHPQADEPDLPPRFRQLVSPVNGIFLSIPGLCRTENLPKLSSFIVNPFVPKLLSSVCSMHEITVLTMCSASFLVGKFKACWTLPANSSRPIRKLSRMKF